MTTTIPVTISLPVVVDIATDMKNSTAEQKEAFENLLETLDNATEIYNEITEIVTLLDNLTIALDNIISLAGMRSISSNCQNVENFISSYAIAITDLEEILNKLDFVGITGVQQIDDYIATAIEVFEEKKTELLAGKSNFEQYNSQQCISTRTVRSTTTASSVAAIIAAAEKVKTDMENKIDALEEILASLDPDLDGDLIESLNTLHNTFNLLNGNLDAIASVSEPSPNRRIKREETGELPIKL